MRTASGFIRTVVALAAVVSVTGCSQIASLKAKRAFKEANAFYKDGDYKQAAAAYEQVVQTDPDELRAYFYLANSYDNLYDPDKASDPANRELMDKAVRYYQLSAEKLANADTPEAKTLRSRSYQFLVAAYGDTKLKDPGKAEPIVQKMIQMDPSDVTNYFMLAQLYNDAGVYDEAERMYLSAKDARPDDPSVYTSLAAFYQKRGEFAKTIQALEDRAAKEPDNPAAFHMIATYYWDETRNDPKLNDNQKRAYVAKGLIAADKAIAIKPDYVEAITFKGLILRQQASLERNAARQKAILAEAVKLNEQATALQKKQAGAVADKASE